MKYTIEISDEGVRSTHDKLKSKAEHDARAGKWSGGQIEVSPEQDGSETLAEYLSYKIFELSN